MLTCLQPACSAILSHHVMEDVASRCNMGVCPGSAQVTAAAEEVVGRVRGVVSVGGPAPKVLTRGNLGDEGAGCQEQRTVPRPQHIFFF